MAAEVTLDLPTCPEGFLPFPSGRLSQCTSLKISFESKPHPRCCWLHSGKRGTHTCKFAVVSKNFMSPNSLAALVKGGGLHCTLSP